jgi:hypothetical protein
MRIGMDVGGWCRPLVNSTAAHNIAKQFSVSILSRYVSRRRRPGVASPGAPGEKARKSVIRTIDSAPDLA